MPLAPKSIIIQSSRQYLFTLLGYKSAKAACRTLMKLSPGVDIINNLHEAFTRTDPKSAKKNLTLDYIFGLLGSLHVKAGRKMYVQLFQSKRFCKTVFYL
jgi:hypothetical protein